jgi:hypothetical protein
MTLEEAWAYCWWLEARMNVGAGPDRPEPDDDEEGPQ